MHAIFSIFKLAFDLAAFAIEGLFWIFFGARRALAVGSDAWRARGVLARRELHCPRGHVVPIAGEVYECPSCGFTYEGSALVCGNPECGLVSPHVSCPTCGLSVRNPYRLG